MSSPGCACFIFLGSSLLMSRIPATIFLPQGLHLESLSLLSSGCLQAGGGDGGGSEAADGLFEEHARRARGEGGGVAAPGRLALRARHLQVRLVRLPGAHHAQPGAALFHSHSRVHPTRGCLTPHAAPPAWITMLQELVVSHVRVALAEHQLHFNFQGCPLLSGRCSRPCEPALVVHRALHRWPLS